jgi:hypothetical protein
MRQAQTAGGTEMSDPHEWHVASVALAHCLAALATPVAARPAEDYQWVQKRDKKTGEMVPVRVPPFARWYLVLDESNEKEIKPPPSRLLRIKGDDLYYRGEKCTVLVLHADGKFVPIDQIQPYHAPDSPTYETPAEGIKCLKPDGTPEPCELRRAQ